MQNSDYLGEENSKHVPNGFGVYKNNDTIVIGTFKKGLISGEEITVIYKDTVIYKGEIKKGLYDGTGKKYKKGRLAYEGGFKKGKFNGEGTLYSNGKVEYEGGWKEGLYDGEGTLYSEGKVQKGKWSAGLLEESYFEAKINEIGRVINYIARNDEKNALPEYVRDRSYDSPEIFADSLTNQIYNYVKTNVEKNVEDRYGILDMIRVVFQTIYPYGVGERVKYFYEATNKGLTQEDLQKWVNTKIEHYNEVTLANHLNPIVFKEENMNEIMTPELNQLIIDREAMETSSFWIGLGIDAILAFLIPIILGICGVPIEGGCLLDIIVFILSFPIMNWIIDSRTMEIEQNIISLLTDNYMTYINMQDFANILML